MYYMMYIHLCRWIDRQICTGVHTHICQCGIAATLWFWDSLTVSFHQGITVTLKLLTLFLPGSDLLLLFCCSSHGLVSDLYFAQIHEFHLLLSNQV